MPADACQGAHSGGGLRMVFVGARAQDGKDAQRRIIKPGKGRAGRATEGLDPTSPSSAEARGNFVLN